MGKTHRVLTRALSLVPTSYLYIKQAPCQKSEAFTQPSFNNLAPNSRVIVNPWFKRPPIKFSHWNEMAPKRTI